MTHPLGWQYEQYAEIRKVLDQGAARMATAQEYADWLEGHLWNRWSGPDINFPQSKSSSAGIYLVTKDIDLPDLRGALGLKIIVPEGVKVNVAGDIGDNEVFFMSDYSVRKSKNHKLQIYDDTLEALEPLGYHVESFIYAEAVAPDFNKAVIRPATQRALNDIHGGLPEGVKPMKTLQIRTKLPQS